jgi:hypothetical protein
MSVSAQVLSRWSDALARALISSLTADQLEEFSSVCDCDDGLAERASMSADFDPIIARVRDDADVRDALKRAWRLAHSDVVAAGELISIENSMAQCEAMLSRFGAEQIVLELLTDEHDDGWELASWVTENVGHDSVRRELSAILNRLSEDPPEPSGPASLPGHIIRVVIFGGHQRDENKLSRRLFENTPFDVRWKPCEKNQGSPDDKELNEALKHADAAIIVTNLVSHNVMYNVKRFARENGIAWKCVTKATEAQLRVAFGELFPDCARLLVPKNG